MTPLTLTVAGVMWLFGWHPHWKHCANPVKLVCQICPPSMRPTDHDRCRPK